MKYLDVILFVLIFFICYLCTVRWYTKSKLSKFQKGSSTKFKTKDFKFKNFISNINFLKTKELFLSKQGYPLKLDSIRYYFFKVMLFLIFLIAGLQNYDSIIISIIFSLIGYFFIDIYIYLNKRSRDVSICNDLYNVTNSLCLQLSAHMTMKDALKFQFENCKNMDLKLAMIEFSTSYELSELNIDVATNRLKNKFEILEIDMFCNALEEYNQTGNVIEILENLSETLAEKQVTKLKEDTRAKVIYTTFGVIIALINIIMLVFYPLFISIGQNFNNIFK